MKRLTPYSWLILIIFSSCLTGNKVASTDKQIESLLSQMTLEEKASLCSGADVWHLKSVERLGIRGKMVSDGPHGLRTQRAESDHLGINGSIKAVCFPAACATAARVGVVSARAFSIIKS